MYMYIDVDTPYDFPNKRDCYKNITKRCLNIRKSLRFVEKETGHHCVRCTVSGDYLEIYGNQDDIEWLHSELYNNNWYRTT